MTPSSIFEKFDLSKKTELDKVFYLCALMQIEGNSEFAITDVYEWFDEIGLARPNHSRLLGRIKKDRRFIKGATKNSFKISAIALKSIKQEIPALLIKEEPEVKDQSVIPVAVYAGTRGYIESLCNQINVSFENAVFDGCAVLMRRVIEVLLISSYVNEGSEGEIKDSDQNYLSLNKIINITLSKNKFALGKTARNFLHNFRELGNLSAHEIYYTCKRAEIVSVAKEFRVTTEELLYKAGLK